MADFYGGSRQNLCSATMINLFVYPYKFCCLSNTQRLLLCEALLFLVLAKIAINVLPFNQLLKLLGRTHVKAQRQGIEREIQCKNVVWAVNCITNNMPLKFVCFPRGISVKTMLALRNIETTLYYGVSRIQTEKLSAHVWVMDGVKGVIGFDIAQDYVILFLVPPIKQVVPNS